MTTNSRFESPTDLATGPKRIAAIKLSVASPWCTVFVGDVTGHGPGPAMVTAAVATTSHVLERDNTKFAPGERLSRVELPNGNLLGMRRFARMADEVREMQVDQSLMALVKAADKVCSLQDDDWTLAVVEPAMDSVVGPMMLFEATMSHVVRRHTLGTSALDICPLPTYIFFLIA